MTSALENLARAYTHRCNGDRAAAVTECKAAVLALRGTRLDACERISVGTAAARLARYADLADYACTVERLAA